PGFFIDRNYAVIGARQDHHVFALYSTFSTPISQAVKFENTLGFTRDNQISVRSFPHEFEEDTAGAEGVLLKPQETTVYHDAHVIEEFAAAGKHRLVGGVALTWGRTTADGHGFDFEFTTGENPVIPNLGDIPFGDNRNFNDRRTFVGIYVNDEWTPIPQLTFSGGARFDHVSEKLHVFQQQIGTPEPDIVDDSRSDGQWSGGIGAVSRAFDSQTGPVNAIHIYGNAKGNFKPAAPNLSEAESAKILDPERTRSQELGVKTRW